MDIHRLASLRCLKTREYPTKVFSTWTSRLMDPGTYAPGTPNIRVRTRESAVWGFNSRTHVARIYNVEFGNVDRPIRGFWQ